MAELITLIISHIFNVQNLEKSMILFKVMVHLIWSNVNEMSPLNIFGCCNLWGEKREPPNDASEGEEGSQQTGFNRFSANESCPCNAEHQQAWSAVTGLIERPLVAEKFRVLRTVICSWLLNISRHEDEWVGGALWQCVTTDVCQHMLSYRCLFCLLCLRALAISIKTMPELYRDVHTDFAYFARLMSNIWNWHTFAGQLVIAATVTPPKITANRNSLTARETDSWLIMLQMKTQQATSFFISLQLCIKI